MTLTDFRIKVWIPSYAQGAKAPFERTVELQADIEPDELPEIMDNLKQSLLDQIIHARALCSEPDSPKHVAHFFVEEQHSDEVYEAVGYFCEMHLDAVLQPDKDYLIRRVKCPTS